MEKKVFSTKTRKTNMQNFQYDLSDLSSCDISEILSLMEVEFLKCKGDLDYSLTTSLCEESRVVTKPPVEELGKKYSHNECYFQEVSDLDESRYDKELQRLLEVATAN